MKFLRSKYGIATFLVMLLVALVAYANSPYPPWVSQLSGDITVDPNGITSIGAGKITGNQLAPLNSVGNVAHQVVRYVYDVGTSAAGVHTLNGALPAGAIITSTYYYINTAFSAANSGALLSIDCEDSGNVVAQFQAPPKAANATYAGTVAPGSSTGQFAMSTGSINAACTLVATPSVTPLTAGKLTGVINYFLAQ